MRTPAGPDHIPTIQEAKAPTPTDFTITPGGVAVTGQADPTQPAAEPDPAVVKGPWQPQEGAVEPSAPASQDEAIAAFDLTWAEYSGWRRGKCPPPEYRGAIWLDELDQAIHEMIGEIGELAHVLMENGPLIMAIGDPEIARLRKKVEDEIGDTIFTASWVFDCIDPSFLGTRGRLVEGFLGPEQREAIRMTVDELKRLNLSPGVLNTLHKCPDEVQAVVMFWVNQINGTLLTLFSNAALISNRFKKVRWHRHKPRGGDQANPFYEQAENLFMIMVGIDAICAFCGIGLPACAARNRSKLDRRFPDGWVPGGGKR